MNENF
jgi:hypothetical protein